MFIDYVSDIHVNHHVPFTPNQLKWEKRTKEWISMMCKSQQGEILVIAGDFSEFNQQSLWVLEECKKHYKYVVFVIGNHDYYLLSKTQRKKYGDSQGRVSDLIKRASTIEGVLPLHGHTVEIEGVTIAGESLWYYPQSEQDWSFYREQSNDSKCIHILGTNHFVSYQDIAVHHLHERSMTWYQTLENQKIDVIVSHVPPVLSPFSPYPVNSCYYSPVPFLASNHWICGHQHTKGVFEKAGTTFYMNPIGYPEKSKESKPKIESFEI